MRYRWGGLILAVLLWGLPGAGATAGPPGAAPGGSGAPRLQGGFADFWEAHNGAMLFGVFKQRFYF